MSGGPLYNLLQISRTYDAARALSWAMDEDIQNWTRQELIAEVVRLRTGIRTHRDSSGHDLCWHHPKLWGLLPEPIPKNIAVPAWPFDALADEESAGADSVEEIFDTEFRRRFTELINQTARRNRTNVYNWPRR